MNAAAVHTMARTRTAISDVGRWRRRRPLAHADREEHDGDEGQRHRHDPDRRETVETTREDRRPQGVADHHDADLEESRRIRGAEVGADDERHTGHADEHPEQAHGTESVGSARRQRDRRADKRNAGDQQTRQRARDVLLGRAQRDPRDGDLDRREGHDPAPLSQHLAQVGADERDRQQDGRRDDGSAEDERRRRDLGHRDPDEQVRDAPDHRHEGEQDQCAAAHDGVRSRSSISQAWSITW